MSKLWAITSFFRPAGYRQRLLNYKIFRKQLNVPLVTVELAFGDRPFDLGHADAERLVQVRGGDVLWQKECLLNIAIDHLPSECEYVAWLDCDVLFDDPAWSEKAQVALQKQVVIQPFRHFYERAANDVATRRHRECCVAAIENGVLGDSYFSNCGISESCGVVPGGAWAGRRELLESCRLYDRLILGCGDKGFVCAAYGRGRNFLQAYELDAALWGDYLDWGDRLHRAVSGHLGYLGGSLCHLAHGEVSKKIYGRRYVDLAKFSFNPLEDIVKNKDECWCWGSDNKAELRSYVRDYFVARHEDGPI